LPARTKRRAAGSRSASAPSVHGERPRQALGETEGQVKVSRRGDDRLSGRDPRPARLDMIAEAAIAMEFSASAEDLARTVHAHPTLPEALKEAALAVAKRTINIERRAGTRWRTSGLRRDGRRLPPVAVSGHRRDRRRARHRQRRLPAAPFRRARCRGPVWFPIAYGGLATV